MFTNCIVFGDVREVRSLILGQNQMFQHVQSLVLFYFTHHLKIVGLLLPLQPLFLMANAHLCQCHHWAMPGQPEGKKKNWNSVAILNWFALSTHKIDLMGKLYTLFSLKNKHKKYQIKYYKKIEALYHRQGSVLQKTFRFQPMVAYKFKFQLKSTKNR